jgi:hypothetical protein
MMPEKGCAGLLDEAPEHLSSVTVTLCAPLRCRSSRCAVASWRCRGVDDYIFVIKGMIASLKRSGDSKAVMSQDMARTEKNRENDDPEGTAMCFRTSFAL